MSFEIEKINHAPFYINNWDIIHKELSSKYHVPTNAIKETGTRMYDWNVENFGSLYTELEKKMSKFGITIYRARFFYTHPGKQLDPHVDGTNKLGHFYWAINFPVHVEEQGHVQEWYEYHGKYIETYNERYTESTLLESPDKIKLIDSLVLTTPHLVKVGIPHAVYNNTNSTRLILSIRFNFDHNKLIKLIKSSIAQSAFVNSVHKS